MAEKNAQSESHLVPVGPLAPGQRWSLARKREVALRLLRGEPLDALSRELGVEVYRLERWKDKALAGMDAGLREREGDPLQSQLHALIADDLECSPFCGEGHRKVWARLRISGVRTSRRRVLRLMREHGLLSPRRVRQGKGIDHEGRITTDAPDLVWGTDGTRVLTADEGMCWIFTAVDHYSCEVVGRHVCKRGDRFAALQPVSQGLLDEGVA